jgi:hypothetical protein
MMIKCVITKKEYVAPPPLSWEWDMKAHSKAERRRLDHIMSEVLAEISALVGQVGMPDFSIDKKSYDVVKIQVRDVPPGTRRSTVREYLIEVSDPFDWNMPISLHDSRLSTREFGKSQVHLLVYDLRSRLAADKLAIERKEYVDFDYGECRVE